jgi:hypothetical protein
MSALKKKMKNSSFLFFLLLLLVTFHCFSQESSTDFSVLFYNAENLFDPNDTDLPGDDEFTPAGERHWTYKRLNAKLLNISKVILSASGWQPPGIIGLCEVENRNVLERLVDKTPLSSFHYQVIHKESPDHRGQELLWELILSIFLLTTGLRGIQVCWSRGQFVMSPPDF